MMTPRRTKETIDSKRKVLTAEQTQLIAKAVGDPRRYEILKFLSGKSGETACEAMRGCVDITPATLSHHMKELEDAGLISVEKRGKFVYYRLLREVLEAFFSRLRSDVMGGGE